MMKIYDYIAQQFLGKSFRFTCDCIINIDIKGKVVDWSMASHELLLHVQTDENKIIKIGANTPGLTVEPI